MHYMHRNLGVCSNGVEFDIDDEGRVHNTVFYGGCNGNLRAIAKLVEGMEATKVVEILEGNPCGMRPTSCGDQFAQGIKAALAQVAQE
ncbi:MAG: TIGR03905 family TSCPD domain-containing protein [bacterium]|nr:TIGR03905 family TSCPD domain-containing protein [bacterium]